MGIFDLFIKEPNSIIAIAPTQTLDVLPANPQQFIYPVSKEYRNGMWVKTAGSRIGILSKFLDRGLTEVAMTDAAGCTLAIEEHQLMHLVRAKISEIPANRINHLSTNELHVRGYED